MARKREESDFRGLDDEDGRERRPRRGKQDSGIGWVIVAVVTGSVLLVVGMAGLGYLIANRPPPSAPTIEVVDADLTKLGDEWKKNPVEVMTRYRSKAVRFSGKVKSVNSNLGNQIYLDLRDRTDKHEATVYVLSQHLVDKLSAYPVGSIITVEIIGPELRRDFNGQAVWIGNR